MFKKIKFLRLFSVMTAMFFAFSFQTSANIADIPDESVSASSFSEAFSETETANIFGQNSASVLKTVTKSEKIPAEVIPGGETFGVKFKAAGVIVTERQDIKAADGESVNPAFSAGIKKGDIITEINGTKIKNSAEFRDSVASSKGEKIELTVSRDGKNRKITVSPVLDSSDGLYHIGVIVKDSTAGLGTITFYEPETKIFGALGHGICEGETSVLFPLEEGLVYSARIYSVLKGVPGTPGELRGLFLDETLLGTLYSNTDNGVFGSIETIPEKQKFAVAEPGEITEGKVTVLSTVDENGVSEYSAEITKIDMAEKNGKNFVIKITDEKLIEKTGGIVQGMSGSPIIQNGKIIGAVTHVFINDPTSGYGIYIGNMFEASRN